MAARVTRVAVRRYKNSDRPAMRKLIINVWGKKWVRGVAHAANIENVAVGLIDGKIVGAVMLDWGEYSCLLDELIVMHRYRGHGVGHALIRFTISYAKRKRLKFVKCFVETDNKNAVQMYKKLGFVKRGELRSAFEPEDHYNYMVKFL